jgi:hypothetical protein
MKNSFSFIITFTILLIVSVNIYPQNPGDLNSDRHDQSESPVTILVESFGFLESGRQPDNRFNGGFTYLFTKNVQADISGGLGLSTYPPDYFIGGGLSIRFPR